MEFIEKYAKVNDDNNNSDNEIEEVIFISDDDFIDDSVQDQNSEDSSEYRLKNVTRDMKCYENDTRNVTRRS